MMSSAMTYPSRVNPGSPAVDPEAIEQLRFLEDEDQPNVVAELVLLFVEHTPPKIAAIRDGIAQGDAGAVKRAAHSVKGSSANVGATGMQHVFVNGKQVLRDDEHTGAKPGRVVVRARPAAR